MLYLWVGAVSIDKRMFFAIRAEPYYSKGTATQRNAFDSYMKYLRAVTKLFVLAVSRAGILKRCLAIMDSRHDMNIVLMAIPHSTTNS